MALPAMHIVRPLLSGITLQEYLLVLPKHGYHLVAARLGAPTHVGIGLNKQLRERE